VLAKVKSGATLGLECYPIDVEVDISNGLPSFLIVGLPDKAVEESRERVRAAIKNSGAIFPNKRLTVNLAPADLKKEGPGFDLAIALGILAAAGQINQESLDNSLFLGELSLNGNLRHINGVLPISLMAENLKFAKIFLPAADCGEAALAEQIDIFPVKNLKELIFSLKGEKKLPIFQRQKEQEVKQNELFDYDFAYIKGQENVKRALEIAAAGGHNVLMSGPPGTGKTLLARALPTILPKLTKEEMLEVTKIYSVAGLTTTKTSVIKVRPFRSPHHTASDVALVGGGQIPKPGEITLAHRGVLFLDEFAEFPRFVLESLRQPLEDGVIAVSRASGTFNFPAQFILVAAQNPCPCGYLNDPVKNCICTPSQIIRYQKKISGPILDRIDIHIDVPRIQYEKLASEKVAEESAKVQARVQGARDIQKHRFVQENEIRTNSEMGLRDIKQYCFLDEKSQNLLKSAVDKLALSARAYHRILKLGRTIADLQNQPNIQIAHIAEALQYRPKENAF